MSNLHNNVKLWLLKSNTQRLESPKDVLSQRHVKCVREKQMNERIMRRNWRGVIVTFLVTKVLPVQERKMCSRARVTRDPETAVVHVGGDVQSLASAGIVVTGDSTCLKAKRPVDGDDIEDGGRCWPGEGPQTSGDEVRGGADTRENLGRTARTAEGPPLSRQALATSGASRRRQSRWRTEGRRRTTTTDLIRPGTVRTTSVGSGAVQNPEDWDLVPVMAATVARDGDGSSARHQTDFDAPAPRGSLRYRRWDTGPNSAC